MWFNIGCGKALDPVIALGESQLVAPAACGALPSGPKAALLFFNLPKATQNLQAVEVSKTWEISKIVQPRSSLATSWAGLASLEVGPEPVPKTREVFVSRQFWVHFWPSYGGSRWIFMSWGFRICMAKGGRESKMPGYARLLISPFPIAGDWLKVAHKQAFLTPYPPLPYIFWTLMTWGFTGTPSTPPKNAPRTA